MKAIIPAAGQGTRLRPLTYTRPKPVLPVANRSILRHAIDNLIDAGLTEIGIVVSELTEKAIQASLEHFHVPGVEFQFLLQKETLGLGHAIRVAKDWLGDSDFCVYLGDNLFEKGVSHYVKRFYETQADALIALVEVEDPTAFGVVVLDSDGRIQSIVEKPKDPPSNLAVAGFYCFKADILTVLEGLKPSSRGEFEITDAIAHWVDSDRYVLGERVSGWWKDTGKPADLIDANRLLLEGLRNCRPFSPGQVENSRIIGQVQLGLGSVVRNSTLMGPIMIGENVVLENVYIGPFTSIGSHSTLRNAEVEYSVIDEGVEIYDVAIRLQECLIGTKTRVRGTQGVPKVHRLILSDASQLDLGF